MMVVGIIALSAAILIYDTWHLVNARTAEDRAYYSIAVAIDAVSLVSSFFGGGGGAGFEVRLAFASARGGANLGLRTAALETAKLGLKARILWGIAVAMANGASRIQTSHTEHVNSNEEAVDRELVNSQDELLQVAEDFAGGDLDKWIPKQKMVGNEGLWWRDPHGQWEIEWNPLGHVVTQEGPHVTIRKWNGRRFGVHRKIFIRGQENTPIPKA